MATDRSPEQLFGESRWVLALARRLCAADAAEDIAQQTMVAALRRPPAADRPLRPWLARVVRNFAGKHRRGQDRRTRHEARAGAALDAAVPSPAQLAETGELLRQLVTELGQLDEPMRSVVSLRYLHERNSSEIGAQLGLPPGTVRWHLQQGLEQLRQRLDRTHGGDRRRWSAPLAAALGVRSPTATAPPAPATPVGASTAWALVGVTLTLAAFGAYAAGAGVPAAPEAADAADVDPVGSAAASPVAPPPPAPSAGRVAAAAGPPVLATQPALAGDTVGIRVRALDRSGRPLRAELRWREGTDDFAFADPDGEVRLVLRPPGQSVRLRLQLSADGAMPRVVRAAARTGQWIDLGDLVLPPDRLVEGRVLDPGGAPIAEAQVFATLATAADSAAADAADLASLADLGPPAWRDFDLRPVRTNADGWFRLRVPGLDVRLWAVAEGRAFAASPTYSLADSAVPPAATIVCPALPADRSIAVLVAAPDGSPIPAARVRRLGTGAADGDPAGIGAPRWFEVDASGRADLPVRPGMAYDLRVEARGFAPATFAAVRSGAVVRATLRPD